MIEHHTLGIFLGQQPRHPDVASCCSYKKDSPNKHRQTANEKGGDGRDDTQDNTGHHGSHHITWDVHWLVAVAIRSQQLPHHTEADALPAALGIAGPSQTVDQFMNHNAYNDKNKSDTPVAEATEEFTYWLLVIIATANMFAFTISMATLRPFTSFSSILFFISENTTDAIKSR